MGLLEVSSWRSWQVAAWFIAACAAADHATARPREVDDIDRGTKEEGRHTAPRQPGRNHWWKHRLRRTAPAADREQGGDEHVVSYRQRRRSIVALPTPGDVEQATIPRRQKPITRSEEHTSELQSHLNLVCRLLL